MGDERQVLSVLHVDDNIYDLQQVKESLENGTDDVQFKVTSVKTPDEYCTKLAELKPNIVLLDIHLVDEESQDGINLVQVTRKQSSNPTIIMRSNADDAKTIAKALRGGADDFISKKTDHGELCHRVWNAYRLARMKSGTAPDDAIETPASLSEYAGETARKIARQVPNIVKSAIRAVHVRGETGTGKEVVADLFEKAVTGGTPFLRVNCAAISPTLLESELFGHVKGAFTGATADKIGLVQKAHGGWLFLDEVATLSKSAQAALLRVIENQEVLRVGDNQPRKIDVRIISATNEDLARKADHDEFRQDLWMRLKERVIELPSLRERTGEIGDLIQFFCRTMKGGPFEVAPAAAEVLAAAPWSKGNIRELRNCLRAMTEYEANRVLTPLAIPADVWEQLDDSTKGELNSGEEEHSLGSGSAFTVSWESSQPVNFELLTDKLLLQVVRAFVDQTPKKKASMRAISTAVGMPRTTLSERFKRLIHNDIATADELNDLLKTSTF